MTSSAHEFLGAVYERGLARFRVWAPQAREVSVVFESGERELSMERIEGGYFVAQTREASAGALYKYRVDGQGPWPDPCSRFQPQGVHGPSMLVDGQRYTWHDTQWRGIELHGQVIYELHIGTFTSAGTFDAACDRLSYLRELGVTVVEVMPVAQCPGRFNWGYDGVYLYAPTHVYGDYDAFKRFVDQAHARDMGVILDVVYNHLGPDGCYLKCFTPHYFSRQHKTEWGEALNFDGEYAHGVREFILRNVEYWIREFHLDGLRLDATQSIFDAGREHILKELVQRARTSAAPRKIIVTAENEPQCSEHLLPTDAGGFGIDGMWNDDFHHSANVALTGSRDGYFHDYAGRAQELLSSVKRGFLYQGQYYAWQKKPRGSRLRDVPASACIIFLDNHDQVGNRCLGDRVHGRCSPQAYRAMAALMLLAPQTPLLFMGQEYAATTRFMFFADHHDELRQVVHKGRREFVGQFRAYASQSIQASIADPSEPSTFEHSKLDWQEANAHTHTLAFHRELIALRKQDPLISRQDVTQIEGATLAEHTLLLRWFDAEDRDRLLIVNLDRELDLTAVPEPLLAPPREHHWTLYWSSEDPRYGGHGAAEPMQDGGRGPWRLPGQCAILLRADRASGAAS